MRMAFALWNRIADVKAPAWRFTGEEEELLVEAWVPVLDRYEFSFPPEVLASLVTVGICAPKYEAHRRQRAEEAARTVDADPA